jgi:PAS domain S-box-containing protein
LSTPDFRALFDAVPGPILVLLPDDPTFTIVAANHAYAQATLTRPEDIVGRGMFEVFPDNPDDPRSAGTRNLHASLRRVLATKTSDTMALQKHDIRRPESEGGGFEERHWSPVNTPVFGENGEIAHIIHRVENVTEFVRLTQKEAEQGRLTEELRVRAGRMEAEVFLRSRELDRAKHIMQQLQESEERFTAAFAEAPIGMVLTTPDGVILEINQAYMDMLGRSRAELAMHDSSHFTHPDDIGPTRAFFEKLRDGQCSTATIEKRYIRGNGDLLWARASTTMRRDSTGRPTQLIAIIEDITERKRAEDDLRRSNAELMRANRDLEEFAYVASHDLQEPLRMVNIYTQLLLRRHIDPADSVAREHAEFIRGGVERMEQLIRDLLAFSRAVQAGDPFSAAWDSVADLNASCAAALTVLKDRIEESGAQVVAGPLPAVRGETTQLAHVFQNLLSNALKYRRESVAPRVIIDAECRDGAFVVAVRDNGIGFDRQYAEGIFKLFKRLHRDEYPGTGLGLAICQRIVERYQGRIWAESEPGVGSTFFISLRPAGNRAHAVAEDR